MVQQHGPVRLDYKQSFRDLRPSSFAGSHVPGAGITRDSSDLGGENEVALGLGLAEGGDEVGVVASGPQDWEVSVVVSACQQS